MKKYHIIILLSLAISFCMAQTKEPFQTKKFSGVSIKNVKVNTSGGGIKVAGNSQKDAEVRVFVKMNNWKGEASKAELEKELEKVCFRNELRQWLHSLLGKTERSKWQKQ